jgi:two-component system cell cycle sensor histidine kinase/response regulator CckA
MKTIQLEKLKFWPDFFRSKESYLRIDGRGMKDERKTKKVLIKELQQCRTCLQEMEKRAEIAPAPPAESDGSVDIFEKLVHAVRDTIIIIDWKGNILFLNKAALELVGLDQTFRGAELNIFNFVHPSHKKEVRKHLRMLKKDGERIQADYCIETVDGHNKWVEGLATRIEFEKHPAVLVTIRDVTDRKNVEEELNAGKASLNALIENTQDCIWSIDRKFIVTAINSTFRDLYFKAFNIEINVGDDILKTAPAFLRSVWRKRYRLALKGEIFSVEERYTVGQQDMDVEIFFNPIRQGSKITGVSVSSRDITERKKFVKELRESENRFRTVIENVSSIAIHGYDADRKVVFWNPACEQFFGYKREEALGQNMEDLILTPELKSVVVKRVDNLHHHNTSIPPQEIIFRRKDGKFIPVLSGNVVLKSNADEEIYYFLDIDLTSLKQTEAALKESEEKYRLLAETARDIIVVHDLNGDFLYMNKSGLQATGIKPGELREKNVKDLIAPVHLETMYDNWFRRIKTEDHVFLFETEMTDHAGMNVPIEISSSIITRNGAAANILLVIRDISDRKRVQSEINMLAHAIKSISECVSVTDMQDKIIFVNDAFLSTYGYQKEELIGQPIDLVRSHKNPPRVIKQILPETLNGSWQGELINKRRNGEEFFIFLSTSVIRDEANEPVALIGVSRDISEHKKLEQQFRQAQKMEAIGRLAGGVAHDFNNLLTIIKGYSELLLSRLAEDNLLRNYALQIDKAGERAGALTRQLLAFSRKQILQPRVINLNLLIHDMKNMLQRLIGEDLELVTLLNKDLGNVQADPVQIQQLVMNMVINARDAINGNGKIIIETENKQLDAEYLQKRSMVKPGYYVMLAISDTGVGIAKEMQDYIFEPFFTTKEEGKGTGLGLATVYGIVKQSDGYIWVYSEPGTGTTFKVYLPRIDDPAEPVAFGENKDEVITGNETVMVVEDEDDVRSLICEALHKNGYRILEAPHGGIALSLSEEYKKPIDLVVTDIVMPHMSGGEFVQNMSTMHPEAKVLYISGYTSSAIIQKGLLGTETPFLQKPFTPTQLLKKIRNLLDES